MKRSILFTALVLVFGTTFSFAAPVSATVPVSAAPVSAAPTDNVNGEIRASFRHDFRDAQIMTTEAYKDFTKLTFKLNDQVLFAFYSQNGDLLAVTRNIPSSQLPVSLLLSLKKQLGNSWVTELFEFNSDAQHCYYVSMENADSRINLRSNGDTWEVFSTVKK